MTHSRWTGSPQTIKRCIPVFVFGFVTGTLIAGDPLGSVSSGVAGVIVLRDLDSTVPRLTDFLKRVDPAYKEVDHGVLAAEFVDLERVIGVGPGTCDFSKPLCLVLTRPQFRWSSIVVGFTPKNARAFEAGLTGERGGIQRLTTRGTRRYVVLRDGVAFVSIRKKAMRAVSAVTPGRSMASTLDARQKALHRESDVFVHLSIDRWRGVIGPYQRIASELAKIGMARQHGEHGDVQGAKAMANWLIDGANTVINQMEWLTLSFAFDGEGFRLSHHHTFKKNGSVARYFASVRSAGVPLLASLPDRPFVMVFGSNWHSPLDASLLMNMAEQALEASAAGKSLDPKKQRRLTDAMSAFYEKTRGMNVMFTTPADRPHPIELFGSYAFDDPVDGLKLIRRIEEGSCEAVASFTPSGGYAAEIKTRWRDGVEFDELRFDANAMDPMARSTMIAVYGKTVCVRQAVSGTDRVVYSMSCCAEKDFIELIKPGEDTATLQGNPLVRRLLRQMPAEPHVLLLADVGRAIAVGPTLMRAGMAAVNQPMPPVADVPMPPQGPLVGWAGVVDGSSFTGRFYMRADGLAAAVRLVAESPVRAVHVAPAPYIAPVAPRPGSPKDAAPRRRGSRR